MITVRLMGGLGNQLFQYAAGRALSHRLGTDLAVDLRWFSTNPARHYRLDRLAIPSPPRQVNRHPHRSSGVSRRLYERLRTIALLERQLVTEDRVAEHPTAWDELKDGTQLVGYWQNERYFANYAVLLRRELQVRGEPSARSAELLARFAAKTTVAVHVRRGDYANNPAALSTHGLCSLEYYESAMELLDARLGQPDFVVFTDDPDWAMGNLPTTRVTVLSPDADEVQDLRLMSRCHSHIIANSSFSWWGAWLAETADQVVIAPRPWFDTALPDAGIVPTRWLTLPK